MTRLDTVGGSGPDLSAMVTGHVTQAEGSFDNVTGVTATPAYGLQLNTDFFNTSACSGSPSTATCREGPGRHRRDQLPACLFGDRQHRR